MSLYSSHQAIIEKAVRALHERTFFAAFPEHPSPAVYGETADADGQSWFKNRLGKKFDELLQSGTPEWKGQEESPYLQEALGITYPIYAPEALIENASRAFQQWRKTDVDTRVGILVESLMKVKARFFEIGYATMHTTGQGFMMAFQASGPHAADRALEAIASGYEELKRFPEKVVWDKPMGKINVQLSKEWKAIPMGVGVVVGCSTFPSWNSVTGIYASLITGNSVIVKPHPGAILPIAIFVAEIQKTLKENGFDPDTCQLGADTFDALITKKLVEHPAVKLIDYTGNSVFGNYIESLSGKRTFTEKTGVNSVILDSVDDIDKVAANLAFSICLYSGQMCTAPQNFYIPENGVRAASGNLTFDDVAQKLVDSINAVVDNPKAGPFVLGAIQNSKTCERITSAENLPGKMWLASRKIENSQFPNARVQTPVVVEVSADREEIFSKELFGPIALLIKTKNTGESIALARAMASSHGAISCAAYTTDKAIRDKIADELSLAATPVSFNLTGNIYVNQHAAFSDFHVTGGNPSGNASFTNPDYVNRRFTWVGHREPVNIF